MEERKEKLFLLGKKIEGILLPVSLFCIISSIILSIVFLRITFGVSFLGGLGVVLMLWNILNNLHQQQRYKTTVESIRKTLILLFVVWLISFLIIEGLIITSSFSSNEEIEADYVVVLGAGLRGKVPSLILMYRLNKSLEYLKKNPHIKVIVSGGQGKGEEITEAEAMKDFLVERGIHEKRIIKEDKSTSTLENIKFTQRILDELEGKKSHRIVIVTSDFHMFRAKYLARRKGLVPYGIPAKVPPYLWANYAIREYFAIVKSWIFDK